MRKIEVGFLPQFNGFGLSDYQHEECCRKKVVPSFWLADSDYKRIGVEIPQNSAPIIGLLFGREDGYYCSSWSYVLALAKAGAKIMFLDYDNHRFQLADCDALVLPGGAFDSPESFYADAKTKKVQCSNQRAQAYLECIFDALKYKMPVLGVCAGAQMLAAVAGMKLYRSADCFESPLKHKSCEVNAHRIWITPDTPFAKLMGNEQMVFVNSRHKEFLAPERVQHEELALCDGDSLPLDIYATATDGIPEAWGDMDNGILCVQWHPEDLPLEQQVPYRWLVEQAVSLG
jgi:gamma-glutamyl-gamma-aminobutyrate hydrolase PuuD